MLLRAAIQLMAQESEAVGALVVAQTELVKNPVLHLPVGDTDRARAELIPVVDHVVMQRTHLKWALPTQRQVVGMRRGERVVREHGLPGPGLGLQPRKVAAPSARGG